MADIEKIKKLRSLSGAGFKDCSSALDESHGNIDKAIEILRVKGISKASKKMSRSANEGLIAISEDNQMSSILEINCETDFVAKNEDFITFVKELSEINNKIGSNRESLLLSKMKNGKTVDENLLALISKIGEKITIGRSRSFNCKEFKVFKYHHTIIKDNLSKLGVIVSLKTSDNSEKLKTFGKQLSMHIAASDPLALDPSQIKQDLINKEKMLIEEELNNSEKPKNILEKIVLGRLNKFKEENALSTQNWVMDPKQKVDKVMKSVDKELKIIDFVRFKIG